MGLGFNIISHRNKFNEICLKPNLMKNLFMLLGLNQHSLRQTSDSYNIHCLSLLGKGRHFFLF